MSRYLMCDTCGHRLKRYYNSWGHWDGETYYCEYCNSQSESVGEEGLSVSDAADIWLSNGRDEDYTFGYTEEELIEALNSY